MKKHRKPTPKTPFERETERRRRAMLRDLASGISHNNQIPKKLLKRRINEGPRALWVGVMKHQAVQHKGARA